MEKNCGMHSLGVHLPRIHSFHTYPLETLFGRTWAHLLGTWNFGNNTIGCWMVGEKVTKEEKEPFVIVEVGNARTYIQLGVKGLSRTIKVSYKRRMHKKC